MRLTSYHKAADFLAVMQPLLEADEAANNLMLGIALRLASGNVPPNWGAPYLAVVTDQGDHVAAAAAMTPPFKLVVYGHGDVWQPAFEPLAHDLRSGGWYVPGVLGPSEISLAFAATWQTLMGHPYRPGMRQRVYELRRVAHRGDAPGQLRAATTDDIDLLAAWALAFHHEALPGQMQPAEARDTVERRVAAGDLFVWQDNDDIVSMAARSRPMPHGITVNLVYTPPELRGRGYATACVAALSQRLLDSGYDFCCLFTDLSNPTSNSIYQRIGYRPVCDFNEYLF